MSEVGMRGDHVSEKEAKATAAHVAAKDAYRNDKSPKNKAAKERTAERLIDVRNEERADRPAGISVTADSVTLDEEN